MLILSIVIGYYLTMTIILRYNFTNNRNKMYQSLLMGFWMALIELLMVGFITRAWQPAYTYLALLLVLGILFFTYLIYNQIGINETQFLLSMQEHHTIGVEMARLVRPKILESNDSPTRSSSHRRKRSTRWRRFSTRRESLIISPHSSIDELLYLLRFQMR